jgi:hypothetical protein
MRWMDRSDDDRTTGAFSGFASGSSSSSSRGKMGISGVLICLCILSRLQEEMYIMPG